MFLIALLFVIFCELNVEAMNHSHCPVNEGLFPVYLPHKTNCSKYFQCTNGVPKLLACPDNLHFNEKLNTCDWPDQAGCADRSITERIIDVNNKIGGNEINEQENGGNEICLNIVIDCPIVDGATPVYGALSDCTKFCQCSNGKPYLHNCPVGLHFNPVLNVCDYPENAGCSDSKNNTDRGNDDNDICLRSGIECPSIDDATPVYGALSDCTKFCQCSNGKPYLHNCPVGLHFNPVLNVCDYPENAGCSDSKNNTDRGNDDNDICLRSGIECPSIDGATPVYGALSDCTKLCQCSNGKPYLHNCPAGLHFDPVLNVCDYPENAGCSDSKNNTDRENDDDEICLRSGIECPSIDDATPVYGALSDCTKFCQCSNGKPFLHNCPVGLHFNPVLNVCDYPENAGCSDSKNNTDRGNDDNEICLRSGIECPSIDGATPVYGALSDCTKFCQCSNGKPYLHNCPAGLHFNPILNVCDYPENAGCSDSKNNSDRENASNDEETSIENDDEAVDDEICLRSGIECPSIDGTTPVYGALSDCTKFCQCSNGKPYLHNCPADLHFNPVSNVCDYPVNAGCSDSRNNSDRENASNDEETSIENDDEAVDDEICLRSVIECPSIDGATPVYGALSDCTKFCQCSNGKPYLHNCPAGLHFNPVLNVCDYPENAGCSDNKNNSDRENASNDEETSIENDDEAVDDEICLRSVIECPSIDDATPVYGALSDCTKFCQCSNGKPYLHNCPAGLHFNPVLNVCDYPENAGCSDNKNNSDRENASNDEETSIENDDEAVDDEICLRSVIECPSIDDATPVYGALSDCTKFCQCSNGKPYLHNCPAGLHFNPVLNVCDYPENAGCSDNKNNSDRENASNDEETSIENDDEAVDDEICLRSVIECPSIDDATPVYGALSDCTKFCQCSNGKPYLHNCPAGLHFNPVLNVCDYPENAGCSDNKNNSDRENASNDEETSIENDDEAVDDEICLRSVIECPSIDDATPVYGALSDCTKFCQCSNGKPYLHNCPAGLHFNPVLNVCDYPENAGCSDNKNNSDREHASNDEETSIENDDEAVDDEICLRSVIECPSIDDATPVYGALSDCTKFCQCSNGKPYLHNCPAGLHFNPVLNVCDHPENAGCP